MKGQCFVDFYKGGYWRSMDGQVSQERQKMLIENPLYAEQSLPVPVARHTVRSVIRAMLRRPA
ncbi:hypothetical protein D3C72_2459790 [compost metagenome]